MWQIVLAIILGYIIGSVPFAVIVSRLKGINILKVGTKNPGAANVLRQVGKSYGIAVWLLDTGKGVGAMAIADFIFKINPFFVFMAGIAAVTGHVWSVFLGLKGGRGASTAGGVLLYMVPKLFIICLIFYFLIQKFAPRSFWPTGLAVAVFFGLAFLFYRAQFAWLAPAILIFLIVGVLINIPTIKEVLEKRRKLKKKK